MHKFSSVKRRNNLSVNRPWAASFSHSISYRHLAFMLGIYGGWRECFGPICVQESKGTRRHRNRRNKKILQTKQTHKTKQSLVLWISSTPFWSGLRLHPVFLGSFYFSSLLQLVPSFSEFIQVHQKRSRRTSNFSSILIIFYSFPFILLRIFVQSAAWGWHVSCEVCEGLRGSWL